MKRFLYIICALTLAVTAGGCAKKKSSGSPTVGDSAVPTPPRGGGSGGNKDGNEVDLVIEGGSTQTRRARLAELFFQEPVNNPSNIRFGMALAKEGGGYSGEVWVSFSDNGRKREAEFSTNHPWYGSTSDNSPNYWFTWNGQPAFHGFFQDPYGAVVVVIDQAISLGDGQPSAIVGGSVWFQNFAYAIPPQGPARMCWQIQIGPYDCRTFIVGDWVQTTSALYPNNSGPNRPAYKKLGSFGGLIRQAAFGD